MKFLVLADSHIGANKNYLYRELSPYLFFQKILQAIQGNNSKCFDYILHLGDLAGDRDVHAEQSAYDLAWQQIQSLAKPAILTMGNHDSRELLAKYLNSLNIIRLADFSKSIFYKMQFSDFDIIVLDSVIGPCRNGRISQEHLEILAEELEGSQNPKLILLHHPPISLGCDWIDSTMLLENGREFCAILEKYSKKVLAVLFGHVHNYRKITKYGIDFYSVPSTFFAFNLDKDAPDASIAFGKAGFANLEITNCLITAEATFLNNSI